MIKQFNIIRFVLVLMIFLHHEGLYQGGGCLSVSAFFILGGICMTLGYGSKVLNDDFSYITYMKNRVVKFFPLHWICLLAVLIPILCNGTTYNNHALLANFYLLQSWIPEQDFYFSFNAVSWYLSDTLFLSLLFPILYNFLSRVGKKDQLFVLILVLCLYVLMIFVIPSNNQLRHAILYIHPVSRVMDFIIGIFIAELYKVLKGKEKVASFVKNHGIIVDAIIVISMLLSILISVLLPQNLFALYYWPTLSCFFIAVMLVGDTKMDRFMRHGLTQKITRCTFSFFMVHQIVIGYVGKISQNFLGLGMWAETIIAFISSYLLAQLLYYLIEKKFTQWLIRKI